MKDKKESLDYRYWCVDELIKVEWTEKYRGWLKIALVVIKMSIKEVTENMPFDRI